MTLAAIIMMTLVACEDNYKDQLSGLVSFIARNKISDHNDMWIVKKNAFGNFDKVGLVFGFTDDAHFCQEVIEDYMRRYEKAQYYCQPAN